MLKKLLVGVVAAGALSVPLAGVAWGDSSDSNSSDSNDSGANASANPIGPGGVPAKITRVLQQQGVPVEGNFPPGTGDDANVLMGTSDVAKLPGSVPDNYAVFGARNPASVVTQVTPGCVNGSFGCQFNPS